MHEREIGFVFEISQADLLGKIGQFTTLQNRKIRTPNLFPVVDPRRQEISPVEMYREFKVEGIITSAYLSKKRGIIEEAIESGGIHGWLEFPGVIMMDSGAYQLMAYGDVDIGEEETVQIQESLGPDIGVPLDVPILPTTKKEEVATRVETTIERICRLSSFTNREDMIWTLPIQGGRYVDLMQSYLDRVKSKDCFAFYRFYALGSVVPVMISYDYETLVSMMETARMNIPNTYPLHLFGAGHPMMFALATAMGYDTFDSAAYILMAKDGRYLTTKGTYTIKELEDFPCYCKQCVSLTPKEVRRLTKTEQTEFLAKHNLYVSMGEINTIRQAIREGRLWDLVRDRARAHPKLFDGVQKLIYSTHIMKELKHGTPTTKTSSLNVFDREDVYRPELSIDYLALTKKEKQRAKVIILGNNASTYHLVQAYIKKTKIEEDLYVFHPIMGLVPLELADMYPVNQIVFTKTVAKDAWSLRLFEALDFLRSYDTILIEKGGESEWGELVVQKLKKNLGSLIASDEGGRTS